MKDYYVPRSGPMPRPKNREEAKKVLKEERFKAPKNITKIKFTACEFTSVCPKTEQPDFGKVIIEYKPVKYCIESKSLKFYLWAYRDMGAYCESLANMIAGDIFEAIKPEYVKVTVYQNRRGGIELEATAQIGNLDE
jgi:7-cyano-7-deazaguanine reductase